MSERKERRRAGKPVAYVQTPARSTRLRKEEAQRDADWVDHMTKQHSMARSKLDGHLRAFAVLHNMEPLVLRDVVESSIRALHARSRYAEDGTPAYTSRFERYISLACALAVLHMRYHHLYVVYHPVRIEDRPVSEVAAALGCSERWAYHRLARATRLIEIWVKDLPTDVEEPRAAS